MKTNRAEALRYIKAQLENNYIDLGIHEEEEMTLIKEALEKYFVAKKPYDSCGKDDWHIVYCPSCDRIFWNSSQWMHYEPQWCEKCGQKIDWSDWHPYSSWTEVEDEEDMET